MLDKPEITPILVDAKTAARICGCGLSLLYQLDSAGRLPQKIKLNSKSLWSYEQLRLWANMGCPSRDSQEWQAILRNLNK